MELLAKLFGPGVNINCELIKEDAAKQLAIASANLRDLKSNHRVEADENAKQMVIRACDAVANLQNITTTHNVFADCGQNCVLIVRMFLETVWRCAALFAALWFCALCSNAGSFVYVDAAVTTYMSGGAFSLPAAVVALLCLACGMCACDVLTRNCRSLSSRPVHAGLVCGSGVAFLLSIRALCSLGELSTNTSVVVVGFWLYACSQGIHCSTLEANLQSTESNLQATQSNVLAIRNEQAQTENYERCITGWFCSPDHWFSKGTSTLTQLVNCRAGTAAGSTPVAVGLSKLGYNRDMDTTPVFLSGRLTPAAAGATQSLALTVDTKESTGLHGMRAAYFAALGLPTTAFQTGSEQFSGWPEVHGERYVDKTIRFRQAFANGQAPKLAAFISGYNAHRNAGVGMSVSVQSVTAADATIRVTAHDSARLLQVKVDWVAFCSECSREFPAHVLCGQTEEQHRLTRENPLVKSYTFPTGKFTSPPEVTVALSSIRTACAETTVRVGVSVTEVTARGFSVRYETWNDTQLKGVGVGWVARVRAVA